MKSPAEASGKSHLDYFFPLGSLIHAKLISKQIRQTMKIHMGKLNCRLPFQMVTTGKNVFEMPESVDNLKSSEEL